MLQKLTNVNVWVHDQEEALAFYTEKLGMEVRADVTVPEMGGFRWLTVGLPGQDDVALALLPVPGPPVFDDETRAAIATIVAKGAAGGLFFSVDDCQATYEELRGRGVEFSQEPTEQPYGIDAGFRDPSGNQMRMAQLSELSSEPGVRPRTEGAQKCSSVRSGSDPTLRDERHVGRLTGCTDTRAVSGPNIGCMETQTQSVVVGRYRLEVGAPAGTRLQVAAMSSRTDPWALASALAASPARRPHVVEELSADVERLAASSEAVESALAVLAASLRGGLADGQMRDNEISLLLGVLERLDREDRHKEALRIARTLATLLALLERWSALIETLRLSIRVARASGDRPARPGPCTRLGTFSACAGRRSEARDLLGQARTLRLALRDEAGVAATEQNLAMSAALAGCGVLRNLVRSPRRACVLSALAAATVGGAVGTVAAGAISTAPANAGQGTTRACPPPAHTQTAPLDSTTTPPTQGTTTPPTQDTTTPPTQGTTTPPPVDTTAPALMLASPKLGERVESTALVFSGVGGTDPGDVATVSISVFPGTDTSRRTGRAGLHRGARRNGCVPAARVPARRHIHGRGGAGGQSGNTTRRTATFTVYTVSAAPPIS